MARQSSELSFEATFEGVKWWWDSDSSRYMVPDLWSSREVIKKEVLYSG